MPPDARLLVADDDPDVLKAAQVALGRTGAAIDTAGSLDELLRLALPDRYDTVLLDMNFAPAARSGDEGLATLAELQARDPPLSVVLMTTWGGVALAVEGLRRGAANFVLKPWRNEVLVTVITEAADQTRRLRADATALNLDDMERRAIERALAIYEGNVSHAAVALGLTRPALYRRMARHGLSRALPFAAGVAARAAVIGALAFAALSLAGWLHYYATAAILLGVALLIGLDLARSTAAADRTLAQFVDGLFAEGYDRPGRKPGAGRLGAAIDRALDGLSRVRAERQRRLDYLGALIDTVSAQVLVVGEHGRLEFANRAARKRLGEATALQGLEALGSDAAARLAEAPLGSRLMITLADGQRALASVGAFASADGPRRLIALQGLASDLDAVEEEAWRDLTRILAHEMMNSLTPICSLAESLAALDPQGDRAAIGDAVEVIGRRSVGLMHFVERYRRLADLPAPERVEVRAAALVAGLSTLTRGMAAARSVGWESVVEPPDLMLLADPDLVEQAVLNLLKNALEAVAGQPGGRVRLICGREDGMASITVVDNGPGLTPAQAEAVFAPFFTTKAGGSGIGLSLARQIALAHGGRLEHVPPARGGAAFRLLLPEAASGR